MFYTGLSCREKLKNLISRVVTVIYGRFYMFLRTICKR